MKIFKLPDLGEGLAEAEIREWYVKVGDMVKVDQPLVSMETAKAVVDVPSPYAGKIIELHGEVNSTIQTGAPFITFETNDSNASSTSVPDKDKGSVVGKLETSEKKWDDHEVIIGSAKKTSNATKAMPAARLLAQQMNVDLGSIKATGPQGLITVEDVKKALNQIQVTSSHVNKIANHAGKTESLHGVRRAMAHAMSQSHHEIVPVTIIDDADISDLPKESDLTVLLLNAIVAAAKVEPALNAWFNGRTLERTLVNEVHIGLAMDTEEGLFVPVIKDVAKKSKTELRNMIDTYKQTVKNRSISPQDMQGLTITLSNFGMIAGRYATPIIVPPCVAILGCGRSREIPMVKNGQIIIGKTLPLSLTFDHRAATGGEATRFLKEIIKCLEAKMS